MPPWSPRVMWWSNFLGTQSGYGIVSKEVLTRLSASGVPSSLTPNYGWGSQSTMYVGDIKIYPASHDLRLYECLENAKDSKSTVITPLYDIWAIKDYDEVARNMPPEMLLCPYVPFDADSMNPVLQRYLRASDYVISMSDHGMRMCKKYGLTDAVRIWHGVDTRIYRPLVGEVEDGKTSTKAELRSRLGFGMDEFWISMVFMNRGNRKMTPENLEGVKLFQEANPDVKVRLRLHTLPSPPDGWDMQSLLNELGMANMVSFTDPYKVWHGVEQIELAMLWCASDVQLFSSGTEGFGLPAIESQACGTPCIVTDYAAQTELVKPVAPELVVKPKALNMQPILHRYAIPDPEGICKALERVLNSPEGYYTKRLREHIVQNFSWDVIGPQWVKFYTQTLPEYVDLRCLDIPDNAWPKSEAKLVELK